MRDTIYEEPLSDADFSEILIKHLIRCPEVYRRAQQVKLIGDDMVLDATYGNDVYKELVNVIFSVGVKPPILAHTIIHAMLHKFENGLIPDAMRDDTMNLLEYIYNENRPLEDPSFFDSRLPEFLKKRRAHKIIAANKTDVALMTRELSKINYELNGDSIYNRPRILNPFKDIIYKTKNLLIGSRISALDTKISGLLAGEYALLIGYSGGGKSVTGTNIVEASAEAGTPATYISCEEHEEDMAQRFYARAFRIRYLALRRGEANIELEDHFSKKTSEEMVGKKIQMLSDNMRLVGMKGVEEITADYIYESLLQDYEKTGFVPKLVMLDQMQFISPITSVRKGAAGWESEKVVSSELDALSHRTIGGKSFVLWVQHQAKGKVKMAFSREEIDGFKGIIQPADLAIGIGREHAKSEIINLFSLKVRHCADFTIKLRAEFEYMNITSEVIKDTLSGQTETTENPSGTMTVVNDSPIRATT